ncbi:MAG: peptidoglycan-associated lipoprotein Pal [Kangiellaceae bacterium]|jgi:peptidoglycan-associated lipoprotein|nr:peptidoglycan-associated lipoprotein Pal [Kangiellaceae bacterium]
MSIKALGKSLLLAFSALFLFACGSNTGGNTGPAEEEMTDPGTETVAPVEKTAEEKAKEANDKMREARNVYFEFDDSTVKAEYQDLIKAHAWYLSRNPAAQVVVEGHCDERGTPEYNLSLGEKRGKSVKDILISYGVPASQIRVVSYGEEKPADPMHTEAAWAKNRRAFLSYEG